MRDLQKLRHDFELLANRYGLTLPAKLKGQLVLEWSHFRKKVKWRTKAQKFSLTQAELDALNIALD